jgi:hypothetical protein
LQLPVIVDQHCEKSNRRQPALRLLVWGAVLLIASASAYVLAARPEGHFQIGLCEIVAYRREISPEFYPPRGISRIHGAIPQIWVYDDRDYRVFVHFWPAGLGH